MTSNLVPTPIVDKNGVPGTRMKKVDSGTAKSVSIPAPGSNVYAPRVQKSATLASFFRDRKDRKHLAAEIIGRLWAYDDRLDHGFVEGGAGDFIAKIKSLDYLRDLNTVAEMATRKELGKDLYNEGRDKLLVHIFKTEPNDWQKQRMRTFARYSGWMRENNIRFFHFMLTHDTLMDSGKAVTLEDGTIRNMEAHCQATIALKNLETLPYTGDRYVRKSDFGDAVDKYPDDVDKLISYITERGGMDKFNEDDFLNYRDSGTIRDGWL